MERRSFGLAPLALVAAVSLIGCEPLHRQVRNQPEPLVRELDANDPKADDVKSEAPKGFFKSTRLPGAMSDEGRDIERNLGVH